MMESLLSVSQDDQNTSRELGTRQLQIILWLFISFEIKPTTMYMSGSTFSHAMASESYDRTSCSNLTETGYEFPHKLMRAVNMEFPFS